jgi:hypothetical protein
MPEQQRHLHVVTNPQPDERSAEEQAIADAVDQGLDMHILGIIVGAQPPEFPSRVVRVAVALTPWRVPKFLKRHPQLVAAVRAIVGPTCDVDVQRLPFGMALHVGYLQWLHKRMQRARQRQQAKA